MIENVNLNFSDNDCEWECCSQLVLYGFDGWSQDIGSHTCYPALSLNQSFALISRPLTIICEWIHIGQN